MRRAFVGRQNGLAIRKNPFVARQRHLAIYVGLLLLDKSLLQVVGTICLPTRAQGTHFLENRQVSGFLFIRRGIFVAERTKKREDTSQYPLLRKFNSQSNYGNIQFNFLYFVRETKSLLVAYLANSKSIAASFFMLLSLAIASFKLLITPFESFVRAATIAFR